MPMRVSRLKGEQNLTELVDRLFDLERSTTGRREIAGRLADANPHLDLRRGALSRRLDKGELIAVPEIDGAVPTRSSKGLTVEAARLLLAETKRDIARLGKKARAADADALAAADDMLATLGSKELRRALAEDPKLQPTVEQLATDAEDRRTRLGEHQRSVDTTLSEAVVVVDQLLRRLR